MSSTNSANTAVLSLEDMSSSMHSPVEQVVDFESLLQAWIELGLVVIMDADEAVGWRFTTHAA